MKIGELRKAMLLRALDRDDFYSILGMMSGLEEERVREIALGKGAPATQSEIIILSMHAGA